MKQLQQTTKADFVGLAIYDVMTDEIRWRLAIGATNQRYKRIVIRMGKGIAGEVVQLNRLIKINHFPQDAIGDPIEYPILLIEHLQSALAVPVSFRQKIYGVIMLGQREQRMFTDHEEKVALTISQDIAKELERANVYDRILHEADTGGIYSLDLDHFRHDLIQYLMKKVKEFNNGQSGKVDFEVLDQSIIEIPDELQETLIQSMEVILSAINSSKDDQINISIGREGNQLLIECRSNRLIESTRETFGVLYDRIGSVSGSIHSSREDNGFHLVTQVPIFEF
ncbi:GAF domain-containing protein [Tepidibacillus marianensis]|uniref:GAF domain-containing protein n=1 Tax=Tepidibacillus marianensis TaxID=3131995 RepID=UPI0030D41592